ncbi:hypothetical protein ABEB36_005627 [Hypothenemus hampei]|uniref:U3 small nucleolar RNA-associated protein 11 n=1 Tax=Hypothenemus hampei TaxID=57062 RepID=A0ABD1EYW9_HYPHA
MSVWKKTAKAHQKAHRERHQPEERQHLGLLEKHKDYQRRARDYNEKKETLKTLRKRALNRNPDEFYHHMINSKIEDGRHFEKELETEDTPEQLHLMRTQDLKYITTKRTQEKRKIEKLQSELHFISQPPKIKNNHVHFGESTQQDGSTKLKQNANIRKEKPSRVVQSKYNELTKRKKREKELAIIQQKIEIRRAVENNKNVLPPKRVKRGNKARPAVYTWKYERKK